MLIDDAVAIRANEYLRGADKRLRPVIDTVGLCTIRPTTDYYQSLVNAIIGQQLSVAAASSIKNRFQGLFGGTFPVAEQILTTDIEVLRNIGFSRAKAGYVLDLARHIAEGKVRFDHLDALNNDEVIAELTPVKGIGEWTVHMFLMFCMGRSDVLPTGDLGIRNGVRMLYGFENVPTPDQITQVASDNYWHPYESIASWYVWQSLKNTPL